VSQDLLDDHGLLDHREEAHLAATVAADQGTGLVDLLDQPCPSRPRSPRQLGIDLLRRAFDKGRPGFTT
jgi:hypothetical protein